MKNQEWQKTGKCLKLVKENEALPSPWIAAGTGLSQGHWWSFMSVTSRSMGRDNEGPSAGWEEGRWSETGG